MEFKNKTDQQTLLNNLSGFGLNPTQWKLKQKSKDIFFIENKNSPSWYFRGVIQKTSAQPNWKKISLVSL